MASRTESTRFVLWRPVKTEPNSTNTPYDAVNLEFIEAIQLVVIEREHVTCLFD